jgi:tetratricopeptide (TPR) repeat protein
MSSSHRWLQVEVVFLLASSLCLAQNKADQQQQIAEHNRKAQQYLQEKRPELALPELQAIIALDPTNIDAVANVGVLLFFKGDCAGALPQLRAANAQRKDMWRIQFLLGVCERRLGDVAAARTDLENVFPHLEDRKLKMEAGSALIEIYEGAEDLDKAAQMVTTLRADNPTNVPLLYEAYRLHTKLAGEAMLALSLVDPNSAEMHQVMGHEALRYGDFPGAITQYREAIKINSKLSGIHLELADALNNSTNPSIKGQAEGEYKLAVQLNPHDERALCRLADIEVEHGDIDKAFTDYTTATKILPSDIDAQLGRAKVLILMHKADDAQPILEKVLELEPENDLAHYQLSRVYWQKGRKEDANREVELYKKYKAMKQKLRDLYKQMRITPPDAVAASINERVDGKEK